MMEQCPVCFTPLEVRECAPCDDCGWNVPTEIDHLRQRLHTYTTYIVYEEMRLTLCNFCACDFGSYKPEYLGFKKDRRLGLGEFNFGKEIENPQTVHDKFCPECSARLKFLKFLAEIRRLNALTP